VGGEGQEPRVVQRHVAVVAGHHHLEIVVQAAGRHAAEVGKGMDVLLQGGGEVLGLDETQVLPARVAQHVAEQLHASPALLGEIEVVAGVVHLRLRPGCRLEADHRRGRRSWPPLLQQPADDAWCSASAARTVLRARPRSRAMARIDAPA
jgi:hypothetical protein